MRLFNKYSWFLIAIFIAFVLIMAFHSYPISWDSLYYTIPLVIIFIFWSEKINFLINKPKDTIKKAEAFRRDLFLISYSFIAGELLSFLFQFNNSDFRGWWLLGLSFTTLYGICFAFVFALFAQIINEHRKYTFVFFFLIVLLIPALTLLAYDLPDSVIAESDFFYMYTGLLIIAHILFCLGHRTLSFIRVRRA